MDEKEQEEYIKDKIKELTGDFKYSNEKFDSLTIAITSGAIALGLSFIKDIVPLKEAVHLWLFYVSIISLVISGLFSFFGHYMAMKENKIIINHLEERRLNEAASQKDYVTLLNKINMFFLFIGILFMVAYSLINIDNYREITRNKQLKLKEMDKEQLKKILEQKKNNKGEINKAMERRTILPKSVIEKKEKEKDENKNDKKE